MGEAVAFWVLPLYKHGRSCDLLGEAVVYRAPGEAVAYWEELWLIGYRIKLWTFRFCFLAYRVQIAMLIKGGLPIQYPLHPANLYLRL